MFVDVLELVSFVQWDTMFLEGVLQVEIEYAALYSAGGLGVAVHVGRGDSRVAEGFAASCAMPEGLEGGYDWEGIIRGDQIENFHPVSVIVTG